MALLVCLLLSTLIFPLCKSWDPIYHPSSEHIDAIQTNFYDIYYYQYNETILQSVNLVNNPNASIQHDVSNTDDEPEIRFDLDWEFKFYGHLHSWIAVSPNGFLTTHPIVCHIWCNWWGGSNGYRRYIAPMMSDFNPSAYDYSYILYYINNTEQSFSVQWHDVTLWSGPAEYKYDFQVKLTSDGSIHFYYYNIPKLPTLIPIGSHWYYGNYSIVIGLEDAAYQHGSDGLYNVRPLSPININTSHVLNRNIVVFKPRETCIGQLNCSSCQDLATEPGSNLQCGWCPSIGMCSDGLGREIYEYQSSNYCTDDEMLLDLSNETCVEYRIDQRHCKKGDHVLAKFPSKETQQGKSNYYSGVIFDINAGSNTYKILYDNASLPTSSVQYSWVHPCSTVSHDYSSKKLIPHCTPHCESIASSKKHMSKTNKLILSIGISIALIMVLCVGAQFFIRGRIIRRGLDDINSMNIVMNESTSVSGRVYDADEYQVAQHVSGIYNTYYQPNKEDANSTRVSPAPIISPNISTMFVNNKKDDSPNYKDDVVELGKIALESTEKESQNAQFTNNDKKDNTQWDMTPLGR